MHKEIYIILSNTYYVILVITAITALLSLKKYKNSYAKYFIYFLVYVLFIEAIAVYPRYLLKIEYFEWINNTRFNNNYWFYTIFWTIGSACFFSWYFQRILKTKQFKAVLKYSRYLFLLMSVIIIASNFNKLFLSYNSTLDYLNIALIISCVTFFFLEVLLTDNVLSFYANINFYITSAIFIWCFVTIPLTIYAKYYNEVDMDFVYLNRIIMASSNIFMYSCFAIGLIVSKPIEKLSIFHN